MDDIKNDKAKDYLEGLKGLGDTRVFPIGAIVFSEINRDEVIRTTNNEGLEVVDIDNLGIDSALREIINLIYEKKGVGIVFKGDCPAEIKNLLINTTHDVISVQVAGEKDLYVMNPVVKGGFIVLIINDISFDNLNLPGVVTSTCRF